MISLLLKSVFKSHPDPENPATRTYCGKLSGIVGICLNALLFLGKLLAGLLSGSVSVMADAVNNLSDASSSVVTLVGFKLAEKPADDGHPYGHARIEYISGLIVAAMILVIGVELVKSSIKKILHPEEVAFTWLTAGILLGSILIKLWMAAFNRRLGRAIHSATLEATAADSRNDVITTAAVLLAGLVAKFTNLHIDGYAGLLVAVFILYSGVGIAKDTIDPLLGAAPDPALVHRIRDMILGYDKVLGIHDLIVHDYGPGRMMISLHAEVSASGDLAAIHDAIDNVERELSRRMNCEAVIHMDPIATDDKLVSRLRGEVGELVRQVDPSITIHDFRMVAGPTHTNLIFDAVVPFGLAMSDKEVANAIHRLVEKMDGNYYAVVQVEKSYV